MKRLANQLREWADHEPEPEMHVEINDLTTGGQGQVLTEDGRQVLVEPQVLTECMDAIGYGGDYYSYREKTFEEKARHAISMLKQAISDKVWEDIGDDGRTMRHVDHTAEKGPWSAVDDYLSKELYLDMVEGLVDGATAVLDEYME